MKKIILVAVFPLFFLFSCKDDSKEVIIDSSMPTGTFTAAKAGSLMEQNGTGTTGMVELGTDKDGVEFLHFGSNFMTNLGTGTVTIFLSTSSEFMADPANGNPDLRLVGNITKNGESYFKVAPVAESKFTNIILWCASANIPFGYAPLQ